MNDLLNYKKNMINYDFYKYPRGEGWTFGGTKHFDLSDHYYKYMAEQLFPD